MSKGSALSAMLWVGIIVYSTDRRWLRATIFCAMAALFAGIGIIHQDAAVDGSFKEGSFGNKSTSPFEFMMGYLSMAGVCLIYHVLQVYMGKKTEPGDEGYEDDHGYLPPIEEPGVDDIFDSWWEPAERALNLDGDKSNTTVPISGKELPDETGSGSEDVLNKSDEGDVEESKVEEEDEVVA